MLINIEFETDSNVARIISTESGRKKSKVVSINDLVSSFKCSVDKEEMNVFKPIISPLAHNENGIELIQNIQKGTNSYIYIFKVEKRNVPLYIYDKFYGLCGMPKMLLAISLVNNILNGISVAVIKDSIVTMNTKLYQYPFSNVSQYNGHVCLGGNRFNEKFETVSSMHKIINYFFEIPNTMESFSSLSNSKHLEFRDLVNYLNDKEFEDELLVPKTSITNYHDWLNKLI